MKELLIVSYIILNTFGNALAQVKGDYIWVLGQNDRDEVEPRGYVFDFNKRNTDFLYSRKNNIGMSDCNASICDAAGNLLFYYNGCYVMNRDAEIMENGDSLNYDEWINVFWGGECFFGYAGCQDVMILPDNYKESINHVLHKPRLFNGFNIRDSVQLWHSVVDLSMNNGLGRVTQKNEVVYRDKNLLVQYLTAISHENQKDWWIVQPVANDSMIVVFLLDEAGIRLYSEQNSHRYFDRGMSSAGGTAKFSPDGKRYAIYNNADDLLIYEFDRATGELTFDERVVPIDTSGYGIFCSVEWSPNSRFIYTATMTKLHQIDTWEDDIQKDGVRLIDTYNGTKDPFSTNFFLMAQAPDCKIYMSPTNGSYSYHVINQPDELGTACDFIQNGIKLPDPSNGASFPNFPRFRVDEEEKCDPTITSVFGDRVYYRRELEVYPSPSTGLFTIRLPDALHRATLIVTDIQGQLIEKKVLDGLDKKISINLSDFPAGNYNIDIYPEENNDRIFYGRQVVKVE